jgi:hypothetical protein
MNHKRTLSLYSPNAVGQTVTLPQIPALVTGLVGLLLLALTACGPVPVSGLAAVPAHPVEAVSSTAISENAATADPAFLAANPELMLARRYPAAPLVASLAANPELTLARRYPAAGQADATAATLAANPELSSARYYAPYPIDNQAALASFLADNPELMVARRYSPGTQEGAAFLADNPELMLARRHTAAPRVASVALNPELSAAHLYAAPLGATDDPAFLAANPELMTARRYATMVALMGMVDVPGEK